MNMKPNSMLMILQTLLLFSLMLIACGDSVLSTQELMASPIPQGTILYTMTPQPPLEPTKTSLITPPPTISVDIVTTPSKDTPAKLKEWLDTNSNCRLPCWWGIAPGITTWNLTIDTFTPYASMISQRGNPNRYIGEFNFFDVLPDSSTGVGINISILFINDIAQEIEVYGFKGSSLYYLPKFLLSFGPPSEVWLHTYSSYLGRTPPVDINLFYPEQGILARYSTLLDEIDQNEDRAVICLDDDPALYLWYPNEMTTFEQADDHFRLGYKQYSKPILPLYKATEISIEQLYNQRTNERICITTKLSLWPEP